MESYVSLSSGYESQYEERAAVHKAPNKISDQTAQTAATTPPADDLSLMEEIYLLALNVGYVGSTSFFNNRMSPGLRGCVLIELALQKRIQLKEEGTLLTKRVFLTADGPTGDEILDEAVKLIKDGRLPQDASFSLKSVTVGLQSVPNWIDLFGARVAYFWHGLWRGCELQPVRPRLTQNLVRKGVLTANDNSNSYWNWVFNWTTHSLNEESRTKQQLIERVQYSLLKGWPEDVHSMDKRTLALIIMADVMHVIQPVLASLPEEDYKLAMKRIGSVEKMDFAVESLKGDGSDQVMWAVFKAFTDYNVLRS